MDTELLVDAAAALAVDALRAPAPGPIALDPGTGALVAPPAAFRELIEPGSRLETRAELAAAGAVHGGRLAPLLRAGVAAIRAPERQLTLEGDPAFDAWIAGDGAALTVVDDDGRVRLVPLPVRALGATLVLLSGLDEDVPAPDTAERRLPLGELAAAIASLPGVRVHRRLVGPAATLEIVRAADGWRRVLVDGDVAVLRPASAAELRELVQAA
jgi:hypothetical protein